MEQSINELEKNVNEYNNNPPNSELFNKLATQKTELKSKLEQFKNSNITFEKKVVDEEEYNKSVNILEEAKNKIDDLDTVEEINDELIKLIKVRGIIECYLEDKKIEVINL